MRQIVVEKKLLHFPVRAGATKHAVRVSVDGEPVRGFDTELADGEPDWWAPLDVSLWPGKTLCVCADTLPAGSKALDSLRQSDVLLDAENIYREALRPQLHFSSKRGWLNDPNGLVFYNGEYHLFYQHNPYGCTWGNMHWGHATSRDLVRWQEHGEALFPDDLGDMFSGSAVVDWNNTSGLSRDGAPPLVLIYTAAGPRGGQCLASSTDGRAFTKFGSNPAIKNFTGGDRDPKVFWHEPTSRWVMVLYGGPQSAGGELTKEGKPAARHTVYFFTSPNLRDWTQASAALGGIGDDLFLYECPDFFELPVDGEASRKQWVLAAASSEYALGTFDGTTFSAEEVRIPDVRGRGFFAAQTYSDTPRRIQIGWCNAPSPGMPFNQAMALPYELNLRGTPDGARIHRTPIKELESLRDGPDQSGSLGNFRAELIELRAEFEPGDAGTVEFNIRGAKIAYDAKKQELVVNGLCVAAPLVDGRQRIIVFVDRTLIEVLAADGLTYVPLPFIPRKQDQSVTVEIKGGGSKLISLQVYKLKSIWEPG